MLHVYAQGSKDAFAQGCTARLIEHRTFKLQDHFAVPELVPTRASSHHGYCAARALTRRPSSAVTHLVHLVHDRLQTDPSSEALCCHAARRRTLVGVHLRTMWADIFSKSTDATLSCRAAASSSAFSASDEFHSLFVAPQAARALGVAVRASPTLATVADMVVAHARRHFGDNASLSFFVASDSTATRAGLVRHIRQRHGLPAEHTPGRPGYNNNNKDGMAAAHKGSLAMADLSLLSHARLVLAVGSGSSFPAAAAMMAPCRQQLVALPAVYAAVRKLARSLFAPGGGAAPAGGANGRARPSQGGQAVGEGMQGGEGALRRSRPGGDGSDGAPTNAVSMGCLRGCLGLDPFAARPADNASSAWPLIHMGVRGAGPRNAYGADLLSPPCRHECACWLREALEGGSWGSRDNA